MYPIFLLPLLLLLTHSPPASTDDFYLSFGDRELTRQLIREGLIHGSACEIAADSIAGRAALRLTTTAEFSDAFVELRQLLGRSVDFSRGGYLSFSVYVPQGSQIMSVKFNQQSEAGSFGGCGNYLNDLRQNRGHWVAVTVPLAEQYPECQAWIGTKDFLERVSAITINPYNANRVDTATLYVGYLSLSRQPPAGDYLPQRLSERPYVARNNPHTITFDDPHLLARQQAYRTFEATTQQIAPGKFGNPTMSIRAYGSGSDKYISWLPDIEQMTGHPVNFHQVDSLFFSYYLTPASDRFDGARLFITTGDDWDGILIAENFMQEADFRRGAWTRHAVAIKDLVLTPVDEPGDVLSAVYELRLDLKHDPTAGPIEVWYDDFGWK